VRRLKVKAAELDNFATDFVNLAQKSGFRVNKAAARPAARPVHAGVQPVGAHA
jgi:biopolymer transport protein ExbB